MTQQFAQKLNPPIYSSTEITVINADTLDILHKLTDEGLNPVGLNMANDETPGGGVRSGAGAQEECIFRRTNYFRTLVDDFYPLIDNELVYSPVVNVFKTADYSICDTWRTSFIACAALRNPDLVVDDDTGFETYSELDYRIMK